MKNTIKYIVGLAMACALSLQAQQLVMTTNLTASQTSTILPTNAYISEIDLISGAGTVGNIYFYDQSGNSNTYAFTNSYITRTSVMTNITSVLTNGMGTVYTNVYPGEYTTLVTNAAATNTLPTIMSFAIAPNIRQTKAPLRIVTTRGLTVTTDANSTNQTLVIYYAYPF
jgi:hypothetical protein